MTFGFETLAIHAGQDPDPRTGAVVPPIYQTSTYAQDAVAAPRLGYAYGRGANPTRRSLEECLAALEGGRRAATFASGMAAEDTLIHALCGPGDHVIIPDDVYSGTWRLIDKVMERWGLQWTPVPIGNLDAVRAAIRPGSTRIIWVETPTNPLLGIADLAGLASLARDHSALLVVDNTFASPYLQRPIAYGAHVVVYSTTKYIGGHSDVIGGALVTDDAELGQRIAYHQNAMGSISGAFDSWLTMRGVKTLGIRMERHCDNAERVVELLQGHSAVAQVYYPGLPDHPGHELAAKQMKRFGGMVTFRATGGEPAAIDICNRARLFTLGESLGGVESLIAHPARMTHASASGSPVQVDGDLVRLSVGIETVDDLLSDLDQALGTARS